jgi:hypothetical protein
MSRWLAMGQEYNEKKCFLVQISSILNGMVVGADLLWPYCLISCT